MAVACECFTWHSTSYTESGDYEYHTTNALDCDSVVTLHLTINHSTVGDTLAFSCNRFDWYEHENITTSGDFTHSFTNSSGCDSVVTLHLTVGQDNTGDTTASACNRFDWYEHENITASGDFTHTFTNTRGCDSIVTLHLTIEQSNSGDTTAFSCNRFDWYEHKNITASGEFAHTFTNVNGCDSLVTLHFTFRDPTTNIISMTRDFCDEGSAVLMVESDLDNYVWSTGETSANITVYEEGLYTVTASQDNCEREATFIIEPCEHEILLPNAISPNGAVENRFFRIQELHLEWIDDYDFSVYIYNRWGSLVFSSNSKYFQWDGSVNGKIYHEAMYNYVIFFRNKYAQPRKLTGSVLVL
jgi:gliding motility-associated-like protein